MNRKYLFKAGCVSVLVFKQVTDEDAITFLLVKMSGDFTAVCVCVWVCTGIESAADHAREDDEDEGQHLQIGSQDGCSFHMTHALGRQ